MNLYDASFAALPESGICVPIQHAVADKTAGFPYQIAAVQQATYARKHTYAAHHPGAGKTPIALLTSAHYAVTEPVLVICPPSIVYQWAKAAKRWTGLVWTVATSARDCREFLAHPEATIPARFIVPDSIVHEIPDVADRFALLVIDEAHRFKNRDARRTRAIYGHGLERGLRQRSEKVLALSGTPMPNNPTELYPYLHACFPEEAMSFAKFASDYCPPESEWIHTKRGKKEILVYKTAINKDRLSRVLRQTCLIRPKREDILAQLPPVRYDSLPLHLGLKFNMSAEEIVKAWNAPPHDPQAAPKKTALATERKHLGEVKAHATLDYLETLLDAGDRPVVFCWHRSVAEIIANKFDAPLIHGGKSPEERRDAIAAFAKGARMLVGTIDSTGTGIDGLQHVTDLMVFVEQSPVPHHQEQAVGRLWRLGQTNKVRIVTVDSDHPIDYAIQASLARKQTDINDIVG